MERLKRGTLNKGTEGHLTAAQDQAIQTNYISKNKIDKHHASPMCRLCGERTKLEQKHKNSRTGDIRLR